MNKRACQSFINLLIVILVAACVLTPSPSAPTATQTVSIPTSTVPVATITTATDASPTIEPSATTVATLEAQVLAYEQSGQLLVTHVTNGTPGGTTQYTVAGESDQVSDIAWSPSGEFVAFTSAAKGDPHVFYIFALGQSSPTDLGPGSSPA